MSAHSVTDPKLYWKQVFHAVLSSPLRTEDTETTIQRYVELLVAWIETIQNAMLLLRGYKVVQISSCWSLFLLVEMFAIVYILCEYLSTTNMKILFTASNTFCVVRVNLVPNPITNVFLCFFSGENEEVKVLSRKRDNQEWLLMTSPSCK